MAKDKKSGKDKRCYSHVLLTQESMLIWVMTIGMMLLAFYCIYSGYTGSLPWLAAMVAFPWTAYGVSQVYYYKKSMKENTKDGIKFETVLEEVRQAYGKAPQVDWTVNEVQTSNGQTSTTTINKGSNPAGVQIGQTQQIDIDYGI